MGCGEVQAVEGCDRPGNGWPAAALQNGQVDDAALTVGVHVHLAWRVPLVHPVPDLALGAVVECTAVVVQGVVVAEVPSDDPSPPLAHVGGQEAVVMGEDEGGMTWVAAAVPDAALSVP